MATHDPSERAEFPSTSWSCIRFVQQDARHPEHAGAVNRFISAYWRPVYGFLRARRCSAHQAEDLTQEFFLRFVMESSWLQNADASKGHFRGFLLQKLNWFLSDQGRQRAPRQVRFEQQLLAISSLVREDERAFEPAAGETPEAVFNRQWAVAVLDTVRAQLRQRLAEENRLSWMELFEAYHAADGKRPSQQALAARFGLARDQVREILAKVQKRLDRLLRSEIREQVRSEADIDEEIRALQQALARR